MAKAGKFNLTELLNSRSRELEEERVRMQEERAAGQQGSRITLHRRS